MDSLLLYLFIFFITFLFNMIGSKLYIKNKKIGNILIIISFIILVLFVGLRYMVGTDYHSYFNLSKNMNNIDSSIFKYYDMEYLNLYIFKYSYNMFHNPYIVFIIYSLILYLPLYLTNKLYDYKYLPYSILIFNCTLLPFCMNGLRQGVCLSLVLFSFILLLKDRKLLSVLIIILSCFFHTSTFLIVPYFIYFFYCITTKKRIKYVYIIMPTIIISILIMFFSSRITNITIFSKFAYFFKDKNLTSIKVWSIFYFLPPIIISLFYYKKNDLNMLFLTGVFYYIIGNSAQYLNRMSLYFYIFQIITIPYIFNTIENNKNKLKITITYIIYVVLHFVYQFYVLGRHQIIPYQIWPYLK